MPIILPKCPTDYQLNKDNCRCKKIVTKKKAPKKVKKIKKAKTVKKTGKKPDNSPFYRLQQSKKMLESNLITQKEIDDIIARIKKEKKKYRKM